MASNASALVGIREELTCSLCLSVFTDPKVLPCLHSFCTSCIGVHIGTTRKHGRFECPLCKKDTIIPPEGVTGLKDNFHVKSIITFLPSEDCSMCPVHPKQEITMFCSDCEMPLCIQCQLDHKEHEIVDIHDANQRNNEEVDQLLDSINPKLTFVESCIEILTKQRDLCDEEKQRVTRLISEHFEEAHSRLNKMEEGLIADVKAKIVGFHDEIEANITNMERRRETIRRTVQHVKSSRESANVCEKLGQQKYFVNRLTAVNLPTLTCKINEPAFDIQLKDVPVGLLLTVVPKQLDLNDSEDIREPQSSERVPSRSEEAVELTFETDFDEEEEIDESADDEDGNEMPVGILQRASGRTNLSLFMPVNQQPLRGPQPTPPPSSVYQAASADRAYTTAYQAQYCQVLPSTSPHDMNKQPLQQNMGPTQKYQPYVSRYTPHGTFYNQQQPRQPGPHQHRPMINMNNQGGQQQYQPYQPYRPNYMRYNPGQAMPQQPQYVSQPQKYSMATIPPSYYQTTPQTQVYSSAPSRPTYLAPPQVPQKKERKPLLIINPVTGRRINDDLALTTSSPSNSPPLSDSSERDTPNPHNPGGNGAGARPKD